MTLNALTPLDEIEAICAVEGVDGVFIGPGDLSADMGFLGQPGHPDVTAAIDDAIGRIVRGAYDLGALGASHDLCPVGCCPARAPRPAAAGAGPRARRSVTRTVAPARACPVRRRRLGRPRPVATSPSAPAAATWATGAPAPRSAASASAA